MLLTVAACAAGDKSYLGRAARDTTPASGAPAAVSGSAGSGPIDNPAAGAAVATPPPPSPDALSVRVNDLKGLRVEIIMLQCAGDCADLSAEVHGGHPPYALHWDDGTTLSQRHVCLNAGMSLSVTATDTAISDPEFPYAGQTARGEVSAQVIGCGQPEKPGRPTCDKRAPAGSFEGVTKWAWQGGAVATTPLVANLTDDNGDGAVDVRDVPDVVLVDSGTQALVLLDGRSGVEERRIEAGATQGVTPAIGDLDADGRPEIVSATGDGTALTAYHGDGSVLWTVQLATPAQVPAAIALADLDHDQRPEILLNARVLDARGNLRWSAPKSLMAAPAAPDPVAVDLDGDGELEVVLGPSAYRSDGSTYYENSQVAALAIRAAFGRWTAVADLDADGAPEVVVTSGGSLFVLDHRGVTQHELATGRSYAPAIQDLDGDGMPEILVANGSTLTAYAGDLSVRWSMPVTDSSGAASSTSFDFLGDGSADAVYADENTSWVFAGVDGRAVFQEGRISLTGIERPVVADVDNDGSADILLTASAGPGLHVISDKSGRWVPARRIMNQENYHVTNVNEDGTIPAHEVPHWTLTNSYRAQAQVNPDGSICLPAH